MAQRAVVCYAAPAFWSRTDFDRFDEEHKVLHHSAFASPSLVKAHRKWFFAPSGKKMLFNPDPEETTGENLEELIRLLEERARPDTLIEHVRWLAGQLSSSDRRREESTPETWVARLRRYGQFDRREILLLEDLHSVALAADLAGVDWVVLLEPKSGSEVVNDLHRFPYWWLTYRPL